MGKSSNREATNGKKKKCKSEIRERFISFI
jgi:hypothetical protein